MSATASIANTVAIIPVSTATLIKKEYRNKMKDKQKRDCQSLALGCVKFTIFDIKFKLRQ